MKVYMLTEYNNIEVQAHIIGIFSTFQKAMDVFNERCEELLKNPDYFKSLDEIWSKEYNEVVYIFKIEDYFLDNKKTESILTDKEINEIEREVSLVKGPIE